MKTKVLLVTEYLNPPYDEGIKKSVYNLFEILDSKYDLSVICRKGFSKKNIYIASTNRMFFSLSVRSQIKKINPQVIIYFPFVSTTFMSYIRLKILMSFHKTKKTILFALQPKNNSHFQKVLISLFLRPNIGLTPSPELSSMWDKLKIKHKLLPLYTNLNDFHPIASLTQKSELKKKYNIPEGKFIITHIGHLNIGRNLESLIPLQSSEKQVVIIGSSSTPYNSLGAVDLKSRLEKAGIVIIDYEINNIEEIYQVTDVYVFPVIEKCSSIGLPLSILEARCVGIPVVTTDFGSTKDYLKDDNGGIHYSDPLLFSECIDKILKQENKVIATNIPSINSKFKNCVFSEIDN